MVQDQNIVDVKKKKTREERGIYSYTFEFLRQGKMVKKKKRKRKMETFKSNLNGKTKQDPTF